MALALVSSSRWDWTIERSIRFHARQMIRHRPEIYLPISRLRSRPHMVINGVQVPHTSVVSEETDIVIEGIYRAGNTFAFVAFQIAQPKPLNVAHHLHAEAQIIHGAELGIPVITLVREPEAVAVSACISFGVPVRQALRDYIVFHERIVPYADRMVVADFSTVTSDFSRVVRAVNERFGRAFTVFDHTPENEQRCFEVIDEFYARTAREPKRTVAHPSKLRRASKDEHQAAYYAPELAPMREEATALYRQLLYSAHAV